MDYKGIYYGDSKIQKFYEYGAHFKYSELYKQLEKLKGINEYENKCLNRVKSNDNHQILYINDKVKNILSSRNNNNNLYYNNPNTQNLNSTKTFNMIKTRKKSANIPINEINYEKIDSYQNIRKNNIINNNNQINDNLQNNYISNHSTRNRITNYIYQHNTDNNYINFLNQNSNNNTKYNNTHYNNSQRNIIKTNNQSLRSRNINLNINFIKSVEDKINNYITTREKNYINNDSLFNKTHNQKNKKISYISPLSREKKLNINLPSSKYINKNLINSKLNPERFNSGDNIFVKNYEYIRNYNFYK